MLITCAWGRALLSVLLHWMDSSISCWQKTNTKTSFLSGTICPSHTDANSETSGNVFDTVRAHKLAPTLPAVEQEISKSSDFDSEIMDSFWFQNKINMKHRTENLPWNRFYWFIRSAKPLLTARPWLERFVNVTRPLNHKAAVMQSIG